MESIMKKFEAAYVKEAPEYRVGDTVRAGLKVKEGDKERIQNFEGVIISEKGKGISKNITIRKISFGIGVEKTIPIHSPHLGKLNVIKKGQPRRAKLFYLRKRGGKDAIKIKGAK